MTRPLVDRLIDLDDTESLSSRLRMRRMGPLLDMIVTAGKRSDRVNIIDIGGMESYWNIIPADLLAESNISITIVNVNNESDRQDHGIFRFVRGDGCDLTEFGDRQFHIAHSNSVIEHVGDREAMSRFASELRRVAEAYFVQTPNYWFPVEPHFMMPGFQWLPRSIRIAMVRRWALGTWPRADTQNDAEWMVDSVRLLDRPLMKNLFPDADIINERYLGMVKSFIAVRRADSSS